METRTKVHREIDGWVVRGNARIAIRVSLDFDPDEPVVASITFHATEDAPWVTSRELIVGGLDSYVPVGYGDIRMWLADKGAAAMLRINLRVKGDEGLIDVRARDMRDFIHDTRRSVPQAAEGAWFRSGMTDVAMARLIDSGPRLSICPVCRGVDCVNADHAKVREGIRVDQWLKLQIEATDE